MRLSARRPALVAALAAACLAGVAASAVVAPVAAVRADDTADQIAQLDAVIKEGNEAKIVSKVAELEAKLDPTVTDALLKLGRSTKSDRVFKAALKICAQRVHDGTYAYLKGKLKDDKMAEEQRERFFAVLDNLAWYGEKMKGDKAVMKGLEDVVKKHIAAEEGSGAATRAITAYGTIQENSVVGQLIEWLMETEKTKAGGGGSGTGGKGGLGAATKKTYEETKPSILKALEKLTGQNFAAGADWQTWWKDCKEKCEWPDKNAAVEPDWATLNEYPDKAYGFTLKKPGDGKGWKFLKPEDKSRNQRAHLEFRDSAGIVNAWCKVYVHSGTYSDSDAFAKYFMDLTFNLKSEKPDWLEFVKGGEPKIEKKTIGGREFSVLSGRGMAAGNWKVWNSCERRYYITSPSLKVFIYFECAARNAWEQPQIDAFWKGIESTTFKPSK